MSGIYEQRSEEARLLTQIDKEYEAAQQGLTGLAQGVSQHQFITKPMERIGELQSRLHSILGSEAMGLIAAWLDHAPEEERPTDQAERA